MKRILTLTSALVHVASSVMAQDDNVCMQASEMEAGLIDRYGETLAAQEDKNSYIWASGVGGTWTRITYHLDGTSCAVARGNNWRPDMDAASLIAQLTVDNG